MITAKQAQAGLAKKKRDDAKAARTKVKAREDRRIADRKYANSVVSAEMKKVDAQVKEAIAGGAKETLYFISHDNYVGECLAAKLAPALTKLGFKADAVMVVIPGYDGRWDEQSWDTYDSHRIRISW
jgi:hypothetical protein